VPYPSQALVFPEPRRAAFEAEELGEPGAGELVLRSLVSLISTGTELTAYSGEFPREGSAWARYVSYPFRPGYSLVGEVSAVGAGVEGIAAGDRVFAHAGHASAVKLPSDRVVKLPDGLDAEQAAWASIAYIALNGVRLAEIELGEAVVVVGMGIVGEMALRFAHLSGAFPLIAVDLSDRRLENALVLGATHAVNPSRVDLTAEVARLTRGRKADVAFEVTGSPAAIPGLPKLLRRNGRLILLGSPRGPSTIDFHDEVHTLGLRVIGAHASTHPPAETPFNPWTRQRNVELFFDLAMAGRVDVAGLVTHRYGWREAPDVFARLLADRTGARGVILDWT
jgi:2-desacetyl-2-hydroxyethyl bacteriochlorophyllide A dehydrogenase